MTELSFLLELLLEHELPKATQTLIKERVKEIQIQPQHAYAAPVQRSPRTNQAASTQRTLDQMAEENGLTPVQMSTAMDVASQVQSQTIPNQIAQTPAAVAAMNQRAEAIRIATSGKEEKGRTSPRKF